MNLKLDTLPPETKQAFDLLSRENWIKQEGWYLAGGTGLSLQLGHRQSMDLDFFLPKNDFDLRSLTAKLESHPWKPTILQDGTVIGQLCDSKISFIAYPFFEPRPDRVFYGSIPILPADDIAVMKLIAISQRGTKRDFFDLHAYLNSQGSLTQLFAAVKNQYRMASPNLHHVLKSLTYFEDAEKDPEPIMKKSDINWGMVKNFFQKEIKSVSRKLLDLD